MPMLSHVYLHESLAAPSTGVDSPRGGWPERLPRACENSRAYGPAAARDSYSSKLREECGARRRGGVF